MNFVITCRGHLTNRQNSRCVYVLRGERERESTICVSCSGSRFLMLPLMLDVDVWYCIYCICSCIVHRISYICIVYTRCTVDGTVLFCIIPWVYLGCGDRDELRAK